MQSGVIHAAAGRPGDKVRRWLSIPELGVLVALLLISLLFNAAKPSFLIWPSIAAMLRTIASIGIVSVGVTLLMIVGEIDLSVGNTAGLCAIVAAWLMVNAGVPTVPAACVGIALGALIGLVNGVLTVKVGIPSFITTLGMFYVTRGLNYGITGGWAIDHLPNNLRQFGSTNPLDLSWAFFLLIAVVFLFDVVMRWTVIGSQLYATGGNKRAAQAVGINTDLVKIACFVLVGALAAVGGILTMAHLQYGEPGIGQGWELNAIAGVVIGGVSLFGGIGTVAGTLLGVMVLQVVKAGMVMTAINTNWQTVAIGVVILAAVAVDILRRRARGYGDPTPQSQSAVPVRRVAFKELGILLPLVVLTALFTAIKPAFLSIDNVTSMLRTASYLGIVAVGQTLLMVAAEIDLSVGAVAGFGGIVAAALMANGWPVGGAVLAGLVAGGLVGLGNGLLVTKVRIPAFLSTLGMLYIARGLDYSTTGGYPVYRLPDAFNAFGNANPLGISWSFFILIGLVIVAEVLLRQTNLGAWLSATGGNRQAAQVCGINTDLVKSCCFIAVGMLAALGGILAAARLNVAQPATGWGWELDVIAAVVIGGTGLAGGVGTVTGTLIGILIMQVLRVGVVMTGLNDHWQNVALGILLIVAVAVDTFRQRNRS